MLDVLDGVYSRDQRAAPFPFLIRYLRFQPLGEVVQQLVTCGGLLLSVSAKLNA